MKENVITIDKCLNYMLSLVSDNDNRNELETVLEEIDVDQLMDLIQKIFILKDDD